MKNPVLYIFFGLLLQACAGYNYVQPPPRIYLLPPQIAGVSGDTISIVVEPQARHLRGSYVTADDYEEPDPLLGKIVFIGPNNPFNYMAVVEMDGRCVGVIMNGGYRPVRVSSFGRHVVRAKIFWLKKSGRKQLVDTYQDDFYVSPIYPTHHDGQFWWSKEIHLPFFHFFNY